MPLSQCLTFCIEISIIPKPDELYCLKQCSLASRVIVFEERVIVFEEILTRLAHVQVSISRFFADS